MNPSTKQYTLSFFTQNGFPTENPFPGKRLLHVGCGHSKISGALGMDVLALPEVDVVHNLDVVPWPLQDASVDIIFGHSVLEHVTDIVAFMDEAWRVLAPRGRLIVAVPYFRSTDSFTDITHKHFFTSESLDYFFVENTPKSHFQYSAHTWKRIGFWYGWPARSRGFFTRLFKRFIQNHNLFYDRKLSILVPIKNLVWEMEPIKK
ncbi:MAG: class I SAM-dependent methyltransferase [Candidatus Campbellbacteria bacterium]|nr:class I SAM-dependent methyltransferase [Candidatus Campbellbacteria bacterium]